MPLKPVSRELLGQFGLSEGDINVYMAALSIGEFSLHDLACHLSLPSEAVREAVERLVERGFLRRLPAPVERYVVLEPFLEFFIDIYERTGRDVSVLRDEVLSSFDETSKRLGALSNSVISSVSDELGGAVEDARSLLASLIDRYERLVEDGGGVLRDMVVAVEEMMDSLLSTSMVKMRDVERFEGKVTPLSDIMLEFLRRVDEGTRATNNALIKLVGALQADVSRRLNSLVMQVRMLLDSHYKSHVKTVEELVKVFGEIIGGEMKRLREFVGKLEMDAAWLVEGLAVRVSSLLQSVERKTRHAVTLSLQKRDEAIKTFFHRLNELVGRALVIARDLESLSKVKGSFFDKISPSKLKSAMDAWSQEVSRLAASLRDSYNEILKIEEEVARQVEEEALKPLLKSIEEECANLQNTLLELKKDVEERLGVFPELFETKITNEINSSLLRSTRSCEDTTNAALSFVSDEFNALVKEIISSLTSYAKEVSDLFTSYAKGVLEAVKLVEFSVLVLRRKASLLMQEKAHDYDRKGEALIENARKEKDTYLTEVKKKISGRKEIINQKVSREIDNAVGIVKEAAEKARKIIEEASFKISEGITILEDIWHRSLDVTPTYTGTWTVTGKDAIVKQMVSMLRRARKSAVLVLPQPNNEVLEEVRRVEDKVRVKVAVQVAVELPVLRELALLNNVEIHWCSDAAFWGMVIDDKEVLIAPVDSENPPVATVSVQEGAVKLYGRMIESFIESTARIKKAETFEERQTEYI